jgi:hypothetical protein
MTKKSWGHPKFKDLKKKYAYEKAEMEDLEKIDFPRKCDLVRRSLETLEKDKEYINV